VASKDARSQTTTLQLAISRKRSLILVGSGLAVLAICVLLRALTGNSPAHAQIPYPFHKAQPQQQTAEVPAKTSNSKPAHAGAQQGPQAPKNDIMATVNGQEIHRDALASACVERFGKDVLEGLVNKRLIMHYCSNRNIQVTDQDVDTEIDHMAKRFKIGREQWLQMLERERGINIEQYRRDILWPTIALRKCAAEQLTVGDQQLQEAYDSVYGPSVKCRLIVVNDRQTAEKIHRQVTEQPNDFARVAMQNSIDVNSASIGGLTQPIRHHVGDSAIEHEVFTL